MVGETARVFAEGRVLALALAVLLIDDPLDVITKEFALLNECLRDGMNGVGVDCKEGLDAGVLLVEKLLNTTLVGKTTHHAPTCEIGIEAATHAVYAQIGVGQTGRVGEVARHPG